MKTANLQLFFILVLIQPWATDWHAFFMRFALAGMLLIYINDLIDKKAEARDQRKELMK